MGKYIASDQMDRRSQSEVGDIPTLEDPIYPEFPVMEIDCSVLIDISSKTVCENKSKIYVG